MCPSPKKAHHLRWSLFLIVFLTDRAVKESLRFLVPPNDPQESLPLVSGVLYLYRTEDLYGFLTFFQDFNPLTQRISIGLVAGAFFLFLFLWIRKVPDSRSSEVHSLILILSGVTSNGINMVCFGHAMKTLTWKVGVSWSFNLADISVFVGFFWLILQTLKKSRVAPPIRKSG